MSVPEHLLDLIDDTEIDTSVARAELAALRKHAAESRAAGFLAGQRHGITDAARKIIAERVRIMASDDTNAREMAFLLYLAGEVAALPISPEPEENKPR